MISKTKVGGASALALMTIAVSLGGAPASGPTHAAELHVQADEAVPQSLIVSADAEPQKLNRSGYDVEYTPPPPPEPEPVIEAPKKTTGSQPSRRGAPSAPVAQPGTAQAIAQGMVAARGWGDGEFNCLVALWNRESGWRADAANPSSGAYGIPQALPGSKMASAGADWQTNPSTQISWGIGYISGRYGTPCGAWAHSQSIGWY